MFSPRPTAWLTACAAAALLATGTQLVAHAQTTPAAQSPITANIEIKLDHAAKPISADLFGIFFEDLNYAADGGLYAELVQNRSFDYSSVDVPEWNALTGWQFIARDGARGSVKVQDAAPLNANNPTYAVLNCDNAGNGQVGLANDGFGGIAVKAGQAYDFSVFARRRPNESGPVQVRLEGADGQALATADLSVTAADWTKYTAALTPTRDDANARLVITTSARGALYLDMVSLFPRNTFHNRPNGLRADLAQAIADLKPRFVRFPGGCLTYGDGVNNIYHWKDSIGPVEQRKATKNIWRYHQTLGLGYFEYFQFCEDIGATPLPVVAAGVSCQNSDYARGTGQELIPMDQMPAYVQDVLDLVQYANGPASSPWGARRAAAGHPAPFHLRYLGVGNEDAITPGFSERFKMIFDAVRAKYPDITIIGTVGPSPAGKDFDEGWKLATELHVPVVDEHYYQPPQWFTSHLTRYDSYDRAKSKVYLGEYASRGNTVGNALTEAMYMTSLERNGDVVHMASYAPLLCKTDQVQWWPDMIYFDNTGVHPTVNYYVQQMFCANQGDSYVESAIQFPTTPGSDNPVALSTVRDSKTGDLIIKVVNLSPAPLNAVVHISGEAPRVEASCLTLAGDPLAISPGNPRRGASPETDVRPVASTLKVGRTFRLDVAANAIEIVRIKAAP